MFNFFANEDCRQGNSFNISGGDFNHIVNVLRMKVGDTFLVSCDGESNLCKIEEIYGGSLIAGIVEENYNDTKLPVKLYLFQGLPKGDKMELIIQKAVELGVEEIVPVEMDNCVVKLDDKKKKSKVTRWQAISESAAKQSKRNNVPVVSPVLTYKQAIEKAVSLDLLLVPYECADGMKATKDVLCEIKSGMSVGIFIGSEGGYSEKEINYAKGNGGKIISLGKRILRTETAAITALSMCMLYAEMELSDD